ncbi:MAG: DNA translocase FtsK 4TM domain-containing protein [Patescibacteria group bacterium]|nr:DNA translocase FtsK 4TM domain-containing protein [Patescibacteria group bacterium]
MKKRRRRKNIIKEEDDFSLKTETKKGVLIVIVFALAILSLLSFFHSAGRFGFWFEKILKNFFGLGYIIFSLILLTFGYLLIVSKKLSLKAIHYFSFAAFVMSFYALLHLSQPLNQNFFQNLKAAAQVGGGYVGALLSWPLEYFLSFWGSLIILLAIFISSILIIFNISLNSMFHGASVFKFVAVKFLRILKSLKIKAGNIYKHKKFNKDSEQYEEDDYENSESKKDSDIDFKQYEIKESSNAKNNEGQGFQLNMTNAFNRRKIDLPVSLLENSGGKPTSGDINNNINIIKKTLQNFGIEVEMGEVNIGPTVTQYTLKPAEGVKLSQIITLGNDLSLALAAHPIRIEAPIPGKSLVGVEVPNRTAATVRLKDIITSKEFKKRTSNLMLSLGKDVSGKTWMIDLAKNPHLLIAGSTGSGKSICINSIILSLFYQNSPNELKFIMIDPKRVELPIYNNTPYLIAPVITDTKKTVRALKWAVSEMESRFEILSEAKKRDIISYNAESEEKMYNLVIVIDELADLMASAGAEIENLIIRLAQMSRAVGIYLILATQRPSVNVITGLIKANITSRIAFSVASLMDSRTILDMSGAEKLLGKGDMLFISNEISKPKRLQGAYISEKEIKNITAYLQARNDTDYNSEITEISESSGGEESLDITDDDLELLKQAKEIVSAAGKASSSMLQRRLRIGYNRAARLIDILEEQGIIAPSDGTNRPREVLALGKNISDDENE